MTDKVVVSGVANGKGNDRFRWVSGLSQEARMAIADGSALVICPRNISDGRGRWYVVTDSTKTSTWNHRMPNEEEKTLIWQENVI